jgi:tetratricopeptide (TPR) repeat protein
LRIFRIETGGKMATYQERVIRIFVSSTFGDMKEERDELVKRVFPRLRKLCEQRGVTWGEVDLRWGITDEAKAEGKVLPLCLAEIHRCRPYFIGLLGERYGWVPQSKEIPPELLTLEPWLKEHQHKSVTELEILHGVLNNPAMAELAFFYFRDPAYLKALSSKQQVDYREGPTPEELEYSVQATGNRLAGLKKRISKFLSSPSKTSRSNHEKLVILKERIRQSVRDGKLKNPVRENYPNPRTLGQLVYQDLKEIIESLYPEEEAPDALTRERMEHQAFARSRTVIEVRPGVFQGVYLERPEYFQKLDEHAQGDGPPLVVLGESGVGKSALLANWALRFQQLHREDQLVMHFIGVTAASTDWLAMLRRIMGELKGRFKIPDEIPDKPEELRMAFANWLSITGTRGRVVLVLDALNQLEDKDGAPELVWLPPVIPANVRLILSTLPGQPLKELERRNWLGNKLTVEHLTPEERHAFIPEYLKQYGKELSPKLAARVATAPQSANPLYLRTLLEELRVYGDHHTLEERLGHYLEASTLDRLYEKVLGRWEKDYERDRPGLVRDAMTLIWAARRGLSETELLELLGTDGQPLPRAHWSPLLLAGETALVNRGGLLGFGHDHLRQAVEHLYFSDPERRLEPEAQRAAHLRLASYFLAEYFVDKNLGVRKIDELPWQFSKAEVWCALYLLLSDIKFFSAAWRANSFDVKAYWVRVEGNSPYRLLQAYAPLVAEPSRHGDVILELSLLLADTGHVSEAFILRRHLVDHFARTKNWRNLAASLGNLALILRDLGKLKDAMNFLKEQERICRDLGDKECLHSCLGNQSLIFSDWGELKEAMTLHKEEERLCRELGNRARISESLGNQALVHKTWGELEKAMDLHKEEEYICRELGDKKGFQRSLGNQALILINWGRSEEAMDLLKKKEHLCQELGDKRGLTHSLDSQALIMKEWGRLSEAMDLLKEEERLCRELKDKRGLNRSLGNQAPILRDLGRLREAMDLHKEEERLCHELGDKQGLSQSLGNQAPIFHAWGLNSEAMELLKEQDRLCREVGDKSGLASCLANQAVLLGKMGRFDEGMPLAEEAYMIAIGHGLMALARQIKPILEGLRGR